jgi:hypothetical protein
MRAAWLVRGLVVVVSAAALGCNNGVCGLALHERTTAEGAVAPGASFFRDFPLRPQMGDMEIDLTNTDGINQPRGPHDAYLTETSCAKLFDGPYPGSSPLCRVLVGPAATGKVSARVPLDPGTYRLWVYGYTSNASDVGYVVDIDIWDSRCGAPLQ